MRSADVLLHIEWINKVLLYSTENYIQHPMINHNGNEYLKKNVHTYICITESLLLTAEINTTLQISCCCSVAKSCLTACNPKDCSTPGFLVVGINHTSIKKIFCSILKDNFIYLILTVLGLCCSMGLSLASENEDYSSCDAQASHCGGFSCCGAQAVCHMSFSICGTWAQ